MQILKLILKNFRKFSGLEVSFEEDLTVIVARNGQGKTSVLDGVAITLGTFVGAFDMGKSKSIEIKDAKFQRLPEGFENEQKFPVIVSGSYLGIGKEEDWSRERVVERELNGRKNRTTTKNAVSITEFGKMLMARVRDLDDVSLPLVGYYGAGRLWKNHKNVNRKSVLSESRTMGYEDCLTSASSFLQLQQWMEKATKASLQKNHNHHYKTYNIDEQLMGVQRAVENVLKEEGWQDFHYSFFHEDLVMHDSDAVYLPVSMLSDGVRAMVSLVADMAWRCAKLNPQLGSRAYLETNGIVLIDEVDLHLHPAWQQRVIRSLKSTFPKIQFIITTHSPQVLSTVSSRCIRVISEEQALHGPKGSKGAESSRLLNRVFGVSSRPEDDENVKMLKEYEILVYDDQWGSDRGKTLRRELDDIYGQEEPKLTELDLYIENRKWELEDEEG